MKKNIENKALRIIECDSIDFAGKDIIHITGWNDFLYINMNDFLYRKGNCYYIIGDSVAFVHMMKKGDTDEI